MLFHLLFCSLWSNEYSLHDCEKRAIFGVISQQLKEYWLDRQVENRRWKSLQNCIFYVYIILWYDQNSNTKLEPKCWVRGNEDLLYVEPGQRTAGLCPVRVTNLARQSGSGFWPGLEPNQTKPQVKTWTAGGLPWPVANTSYKTKNHWLSVEVHFNGLSIQNQLSWIIVFVRNCTWWLLFWLIESPPISEAEPSNILALVALNLLKVIDVAK